MQQRSPPVDNLTITPLSAFDSPHANQVFLYNPAGKKKSRKVGYAEVGDPNGVPVVCLAGWFGPRQVAVLFDLFARKAGVRLIWPERPGYGLSPNQRMRKNSVLEWAEIISQLADSLKIAKFGLLGHSLGAVYAMGMASKIPSRILTPVYLVSPWISTKVSQIFRWTRFFPACLTSVVLRGAFKAAVLQEKVKQMQKRGPMVLPPLENEEDEEKPNENNNLDAKPSNDEDGVSKSQKKRRTRRFRTILDPPGQLELCYEMEKRVLKDGHVSGVVNDAMVALEKCHPFGFSYKDVTLPVKVLWGDRDDLIPHAAVVWMQEEMLDCDLRVYEGSGHALLMRAGVVEDAFRGLVKAQKTPHRDSGLGMYMTLGYPPDEI
ncbi:Alpha/Beta hydrolase protein [Jimgerdemannia flammicorona]|uniref:Alpha/Beta hydrolase protein n=1 Tax=Jimgerdemannia flammicorona TaxID=994334 RepID=A0A433D387_9FUNG|nr:Alpha/Beta hydrolase protein [Jimgerdemannia flammicorona]